MNRLRLILFFWLLTVSVLKIDCSQLATVAGEGIKPYVPSTQNNTTVWDLDLGSDRGAVASQGGSAIGPYVPPAAARRGSESSGTTVANFGHGVVTKYPQLSARSESLNGPVAGQGSEPTLPPLLPVQGDFPRGRPYSQVPQSELLDLRNAKILNGDLTRGDMPVGWIPKGTKIKDNGEFNDNPLCYGPTIQYKNPLGSIEYEEQVMININDVPVDHISLIQGARSEATDPGCCQQGCRKCCCTPRVEWCCASPIRVCTASASALWSVMTMCCSQDKQKSSSRRAHQLSQRDPLYDRVHAWMEHEEYGYQENNNLERVDFNKEKDN